MEQEYGIPKHIALIPDGNRRWAKQRGLDTLEGHKAGLEQFIDFAEWCHDKGVRVVSAFGFSTENWKRSEREVSYLLALFEETLLERLRKYEEEKRAQGIGVRVRIIGDEAQFPQSLQDAIRAIEERTHQNADLIINVALNYGGRWDIIHAAREMLKSGIRLEDVTEQRFAAFLSTGELADIDLLIRTSGEQRISNFMLWQMAYAELYFYAGHWPDFGKQDLEKALQEYAKRKRRFGA